jgi:hypothetical protein
MKFMIPFVAAVVVLAGCENKNDRILFDGAYFRTTVKKVDKQLDVFTVQIRNVSQSLDGASEAGEYAGIDHCVRNFGTSDIEWSIGPDTPAEQLRVIDDNLIFSGVCPQR